MFQSVIPKDANTHILIDDEFQHIMDINIQYNGGCVRSISVAIACEYVKRDALTAAKNIAMYIIYQNNRFVSEPIFYQDTYCPHLISSWSEIAKERDKYIEMLSLLK